VSTFDTPLRQHRDGRRLVPILRLQVLVGRGRLDGRLAAGGRPASDPQLALRARQLSRPAARARLAACLRDAVRSIDDTPLVRHQRPEVPVAAASARACAWEIEELARALTSPTARVGGVAIVHRLLTDGRGPLYDDDPAGRLRATVLAARSAL
jgi:hypothetical protein